MNNIFLCKNVSQTTVLLYNWVTQRRQRFLVSLGLLRLQRLFGERKHVFNVTRVSLKQLNKVTSSREIYEVAKNVKLTLWKLIQPFTPPPLWNFLGHWPPPPHPSGISNSLRGGGMDIFWNHTLDCITQWRHFWIILGLQSRQEKKIQMLKHIKNSHLTKIPP